jgi:hypothetical protein
MLGAKRDRSAHARRPGGIRSADRRRTFRGDVRSIIAAGCGSDGNTPGVQPPLSPPNVSGSSSPPLPLDLTPPTDPSIHGHS